MPKYMVAPGKALTTRAGIIGEFQEIDVKKIGDAGIFNALIRCGSICEFIPKPEFSKSRMIDLRYKAKYNQNVIEKPARADVTGIEIIEPKAEIKRKTPEEKPEEITEEKPIEEKPEIEAKPKRKYSKKKSVTE